MQNPRNLDPDIHIYYPLLIHYGVNAAVLWGWVQYQLMVKKLHITDIGMDTYHMHVSRWQIKEEIGLSFGEQIDAELALLGADLVTSSPVKFDEASYYAMPLNEEKLRYFVNSKRQKWDVKAYLLP